MYSYAFIAFGVYRCILLTIDLKAQFSYLIALNRQEVQRVNRLCYSGELVAHVDVSSCAVYCFFEAFSAFGV